MGFNNTNILQLGSRIPQEPKIYTRPSDWVSITGVPTGEIYYLVSDAINTTYSIQFTSSGGGVVYIDWGDGTSDTYAASSTAVHTFTSGGTACSLGYDTWKISMSADSGTQITASNVVVNTNEFSQTPNGLLEAWFGENTITNSNALFLFRFKILEFVKLPETSITSSNAFENTFNGCTSLQKVILPTTASSVTTIQNMFFGCFSILEAKFPINMTGLTNASEAFNSCSNLQNVSFPPIFPNLTSIYGLFNNCYSLSFIDLPLLPLCTEWTIAFGNCEALTSINFKTLKPSSSHNFNSTFQNCYCLNNVTFPNTVSNVTLSLPVTFINCFNLFTCTFPINATVSTFNGTFANCFNLTSVVLPNDASSCTTFQNLFNGARALRSITLPSIPPTNPVSFDSTFNNCVALDSVNIPSGYTITSLYQAFNECHNITNITFNGPQDSCTTVERMCYLDYNLQTITLPTSMSACTNYSFIFYSCYGLKGPVIYPSTMSVLDTFTYAHFDNYSLRSLTYPTTIKGNNGNFFQMNLRNQSMTSITLPATITSASTITSMGMLFFNSPSYKTITLPTTQLTGLNNIDLMFYNNWALTTINNTDYLGDNSTSSTTYLNTNDAFYRTFSLTGLTFTCKFSRFVCNGENTTTEQSRLSLLRMTNTGSGQWDGGSPQIDISYTTMSTAALNTFFADIAAQGSVSGKTINITNATGAAGLSSGDRAVLTSLGWTITG